MTEQTTSEWMESLGFSYQAPGTSTATAEWWKTNAKGEFELYMTQEQAEFMHRICKEAETAGRIDQLAKIKKWTGNPICIAELDRTTLVAINMACDERLSRLSVPSQPS